MSDSPLRFCLTCRAMAVLVLAGGIALAFSGLGGTLEQKSPGAASVTANIADAEPILFFAPDERRPAGFAAPHFSEPGFYGEI